MNIEELKKKVDIAFNEYGTLVTRRDIRRGVSKDKTIQAYIDIKMQAYNELYAMYIKEMMKQRTKELSKL